MLINESNNDLKASLKDYEEKLLALANESRDDLWKLLVILRGIEDVHRHIREELFEPSLPNNRQKLYQLLKEVDELGGWPYIPRMRLQEFFINYQEAQKEKY